jgi:hypothetical protein
MADHGQWQFQILSLQCTYGCICRYDWEEAGGMLGLRAIAIRTYCINSFRPLVPTHIQR